MTNAVKKFSFGKLFKDTRSELRKITWPSLKELIQHTEVVITSIIIVGIVIAVFDYIFGSAITWIPNLLK